MVFTKDLHTHSKYSKFGHGKSSIEEMVQVAIQKNFDTIAITDHGPGHPFGVWRHKLKKRKEEIERLRKKYPNIKILVGLETNLISKSGRIDISAKERADLDICLMGYHRMGCGNIFWLFTYNIWKTVFGKNQIKSNTEAYLNALRRNKIDILTHLQQHIRVDCGKVAEEAAKHGTLIEINNKQLLWTKEDIEAMLATDCKFIVSSDAHKAQNVGKFDVAEEFIKKYNIPLSRIVNVREIK